MRHAFIAVLMLLPMQAACAQGKPQPAPSDGPSAPAGAATSDAASDGASDEEIFTAAGFNRTTRGWEKCGDDTGSPAYTPGTIEQRGDFNGDGRPDAVVAEGSSYCFGMTGTGYTLVSQQADGGWRIMDEQPGILSFLGTMGRDGWPDISVGGPGFCFPVVRWNGSEYAWNRSEYEGRPCRP